MKKLKIVGAIYTFPVWTIPVLLFSITSASQYVWFKAAGVIFGSLVITVALFVAWWFVWIKKLNINKRGVKR